MKNIFSFVILMATVIPQSLLASEQHFSSCSKAAVSAAQLEVQHLTVPIVSMEIEVIKENREYIVIFGSYYISFDYRVLTKQTGATCTAEVF